MVEDNVFTYLENGDYTARENNTEYVNDNKTYFASQYNESYKEIEKIQYSFYTTGALYSITSTLGNISQTLCSLIVKLAHSTNIDSDSMLEIDNAIFELTKGSATTNRFYVDIDSDNNVVLPMNTMSEMTELVQTRVGDNIVFNTKSSVDFDRPLEAVSDGSSDLGRVFDFDYTKYYNSSVTSVSGIKETEEDLHILAQLLQEHADSPDQLHMCYGRVAVINGKLVSLPDELFYNNGGWMLESAQRFSYSGGNELMLDLIDNGYVLENIGLTRIPGTDYTINIRNEIDKSDCRYDAVKSYLSNNSWEYVYLYPYSVANPFRITVDLSGETSNENISNFLDKLQALSSDSFETKAAQATFNNQYYNSTSNELGFEYSVDSVGGWNSGYLSNGIQLYYSTNWTRVYDGSSILDETGTSSGSTQTWDIRSIAGNRGRINTYAEFGGTESVRSSSYKNGRWRYYNQTNVYSPLKIVLDFKSNNYELMNKYLEIVNECGFNVIGNESYMPDFDNADKISVKSFLPYTESIGVKGTWVHTDAAAYAKYGDFESGVKKNTDEIIEDTYDGYQISFPLDMLQNKEKGTPYNVVNQVMMMSTEINGHYDYSDARLGAYYRDGTWAHKGNVYYLDGEFIRQYNTATEDVYSSYYDEGCRYSLSLPDTTKGLLRHTEYKWGEVVLASRPDPVEDLAFDKNTFKLTFTKPVDEGFGVETSDTPERETTKKDDVVYVNSYTIKVVNDQDEVTYETTIARDQKFDDVTFVVPENAVDYSSRKNKIVVYCTNILGDSVEREIEFELTPAVEITMTPDKPLYKDSETVVYTETVKNTGETKLTNVIVNQDLIGQYVPQDGLTPMGTTAKIPDLKPGESYTFYFKVPASVAVDDIIINNADVETAQNVSDDDTCTVNVYRVESQDTPKPAEYDIKVSTTYEKKVYNDLEDIVFIDVVTNTGDTTLTNVVVREAFTNGGYTDVADGTLNKNGSVTIDKLEPGESVTLLYTINAKDAPIAEDGTVINNLTAPADEGVSDDDSTLVEVVHYSINVTKLVENQNYRKGDKVVFTNIVTNDGNTKLTNIKVTEDLDGTFTLTNGAVIMNDHIMIAELAPGESYTYYYVVPANDENVADGRVTSVVTATASEDSISVSSDKVSDEDDNFALVSNPVIDVTKTVDSKTYKIGDKVVWTDTITNNGDVPLTNVVVTESIDGTFDVEYETNGNSFIIPKLDVGESYTYTFTTVVTNENVDEIHAATVKAAADEGVNDNDTKEVPVNAAAIKVVKTVTEYEYAPDGTIIYTDIITNTGNADLTEVIVKEDLPGRFISYDPEYTADGDTLTIDRIEKGQTVVVKYEVKVSDVDYSEEDPTITSTVTAEAKEGVKDDDSVDVIVIIPDPEPVSEDSEPVSENVEPDTTTDIEPEVEKDSEPDTTTDVIVPETTTDTESVSETDSDNTKIEGGTVEKDSEPEITTDTNTTTDTTVPESETDTTVVPETNPDTTVVPETNPDTTVVPETNPDTTVVPEPETDTTVVPEPTTDTTSETPSDTPTTDTSQTQIGGGTAEKKDSDTPKTETDNKQNTTPTTTTTTTVVNNPIPQQSGGGSADPVKTGDSRNAIGYAVAMLTALFVFAVCRKREEDQF